MNIKKERIQKLPGAAEEAAATEKSGEAQKCAPSEKKGKKWIWALIGIVGAVLLLVFIVRMFSGGSDKSQEPNSVAFLIQPEGTRVLSLQAGQETPWMGTEEGRIADISYSSPDYSYTLKYSDGTSYEGGDNVAIPVKRHCYVKIHAKKDQLVTITVKYR